jgi:hypothetical protein
MRVAALTVPVLALAACGGSATSGDLVQAAKETADGTSRFEMRYRSDNDEFRAELAGLFDYARERGVITEMEFEEPAGVAEADASFPEEVRFIEDSVYVATKVDGVTHWVEEPNDTVGDPRELLLPFPGGANDPGDIFRLILRTSTKIQNLGVEEVRGDEATHYRAELDPEKLLEELPAAERAGYADEARESEPLPVEAWIDHENRVRRVSVRDEMEKNDWMTTTFEFFDFGVDVDVQPPPADKLISQERLDKLQGVNAFTDEELEAFCREEAPKDVAREACDGTEASE